MAAKHGVEVNFAYSDWQSFEWKTEHYDLVAGLFFQFATPMERVDLFDRIRQSLKPGGLLVIRGYEVQACETYEATIHGGTGHDGMSALVGFVAIKP